MPTRAVATFIALVLAVIPGTALAQGFTIDFGDDGSLTARSLQLIALITVLSLAPWFSGDDHVFPVCRDRPIDLATGYRAAAIAPKHAHRQPRAFLDLLRHGAGIRRSLCDRHSTAS